MLSLICGIVVLVLGCVGLAAWWNACVQFVMGSLPLALIGAGLIGIIAGVTSISENAASKKDEIKLKKN